MALEAVRGGMGLNASATEYGVPKATLKRHFDCSNKFANGSSTFFGRPTVFSPKMEEELVKYLLDMDRMMFGLTRNDVRSLSYQVAEKQH